LEIVGIGGVFGVHGRWIIRLIEELVMKRLRLAGILVMWVLGAVAFGQGEWLGVYLQGQKIGYSYSETKKEEFEGKPVEVSRSKMEIGTQMLGSAMRIVVDSATWMSGGKPLQMTYRMESAGRTMAVNARFGANEIVASMVTGSGEEEKRIPIPAGKRILMDPVDLVNSGGVPVVGKPMEVLVFSPESLELVAVTVEARPEQEISTPAGRVKAMVVFVNDPRAPTTLYLSPKGDLIKMTGPMGIEMIPESEEEAKKFTGTAQIDLAAASRLTPVGRVNWGDPQVELMVRGIDMSKVPSDARQKVIKSGDGWRVTLGSDVLPDGLVKISSLKGQKSEWLKPDVRVPSGDQDFVDLAKKVVGGTQTVAGAAAKIHDYVFRLMGVNAGIGVMRDAREILETKEGVCRDHAILAGTLLRAAGIPTRFANGLVLYQGSYYYHAWVEYWDGKNWIGMDTTRPDLRLGSGYIKTTQGTVGQALQGFLLDGAKIEVVEK
jgi:hypothetical protein